MGRIVIAAYRPKAGKREALRRLTLKHVAMLRSEGLVTSRVPITMEAKDGTVVEVFEWKSQAAIEAAHTNPVVLKMWGEYGEACDYIPVGEVPEAKQMFSEFAPIELSKTRPAAAATAPGPRKGRRRFAKKASRSMGRRPTR